MNGKKKIGGESVTEKGNSQKIQSNGKKTIITKTVTIIIPSNGMVKKSECRSEVQSNGKIPNLMEKDVILKFKIKAATDTTNSALLEHIKQFQPLAELIGIEYLDEPKQVKHPIIRGKNGK